jgi:hypothetical protein
MLSIEAAIMCTQRLSSAYLLMALFTFAPACRAQGDNLTTFGTTVVIPGGLMGKIYFLRSETWVLPPDFEKLEPVGTIYAKGFQIQPRDFREGFPGVTERTEWFALDFKGWLYIEKPGEYSFRLASDDGAKLYVDRNIVIDNDGDHPSVERKGSISLTGGIHSIRLSYFQGPAFELALVLDVKKPGDLFFHSFNTDNFKPPTDPDTWKSAPPEEWKNSPEPGLMRRTAAPSAATQTVPLSVEVLSHGEAVRDLKSSEIVVSDNGRPREIASFGFANRIFDIMLLVDESSITERIRGKLRDFALQALSKPDRRDHMALMGFGSSQKIAIGFNNRPDRVARALADIPRSNGATDLNGAIAMAALYLREFGRPEATPAIVMLTLNNGPREVSERPVRDALWQSGITVSAVVPKLGPQAKSESAGSAGIRPFVEATGGDLLEMDAKNVPLGDILRRLQERYAISIYAAEGAQPKEIRSLTVDLTAAAKARLGDYKIAARRAYVIQTAR